MRTLVWIVVGLFCATLFFGGIFTCLGSHGDLGFAAGLLLIAVGLIVAMLSTIEERAVRVTKLLEQTAREEKEDRQAMILSLRTIADTMTAAAPPAPRTASHQAAAAKRPATDDAFEAAINAEVQPRRLR